MKQVRMYYRSGTDGSCCIEASRRFMFTRQVAALCCVKWRQARHHDGVASDWKSDSVSRCVFTPTTILPNIIPIRFEKTEPWAFVEEVAHREQQQRQQQQKDEQRYEISPW